MALRDHQPYAETMRYRLGFGIVSWAGGLYWIAAVLLAGKIMVGRRRDGAT